MEMWYIIVDSLEKCISASQLVIGNFMKIFRIFVKTEKNSVKFLAHMSSKIPGNFLDTSRAIPGPLKGPVHLKGPEA